MSLLLAVWPLCRVRSDLQDFVVMLLRKMMYRQDVDGRWDMDRVKALAVVGSCHSAAAMFCSCAGSCM